MKKILTAIIFILCAVHLISAQTPKSPYRIFGQITTIENKVMAGYITWGNKRMWWTDFFEASKKNNPYVPFFKNKGVYFAQGTEYSVVPPTHVFICRFGDIEKIRLVGSNTIELYIKDGNYIDLKKGTSNDIGGSVEIFDGIATYQVKWDQISEVKFSAPNTSFVASPEQPITGIVRTPQGVYKGIVRWSASMNILQSQFGENTSLPKILIPFKNIVRIEQSGSTINVSLGIGEQRNVPNFVNGSGPISVNMPNVGGVTIPINKFKIFESTPLESVDLLSYDDFKAPQRLKGEVVTQDGQTIKGNIAYDLDESMDIEILDGLNDNIAYRIPFKYIKSIEPKNYRYSFITLRNGTTLSLGDGPDVNEKNSGVIVFPEGDNTPVYVAWKEVKQITFQ